MTPPDRSKCPYRDPRRAARGASRARARLLGLLIGVLALAACSSPPRGPRFEPAAPPPENRGRVYVYRVDDRGSLATVFVTIDGRKLGSFDNLEYDTLELAAGSHHLRAGMRGFAWMAWGWNDQRFRIEPGETVYLELSVRLSAQPVTGTRELEIAGRASGGASENVFILRQGAAEANTALAQTTRLAEPADP
jgi:hypothetical protein